MLQPEAMRQRSLVYCRSLEDVIYWIQTFTDFSVELELRSNIGEQCIFLVPAKIPMSVRHEIKEVIKKFTNGTEEGEKALMLFASEDSFDEISELAYRAFVRLPLEYDALLWPFLNRIRQAKIDCFMTIPNSEEFVTSDWLDILSKYTWRKDSKFCVVNESIDGPNDFLWVLHDIEIMYLGAVEHKKIQDLLLDRAYDAAELKRFLCDNNIERFATIMSRNDFAQLDHEYEFVTSFLENMRDRPQAVPLLYFGNMTRTMPEWIDSTYGFSITSFYPNDYIFLFDATRSVLTLLRSGHILAQYLIDADTLKGAQRVVFADNPQQIDRALLNFEGAQRIYYKAKYIAGSVYPDVQSGRAYMVNHPHILGEWLQTLLDSKNLSAGAGN